MTKLTKLGITSILSIVLLFPNTGIIFADSIPIQQDTGSISAQSANVPEIPTHAAKLRDMVDIETNRHPDWVGLISWNETDAKIDYLGPADKNPYRIDQSRWAHAPPTVNNTKIEQVTMHHLQQT